MGKVWRARHTTLNRDDALKVLPQAFSALDAVSEQMMRTGVQRDDLELIVVDERGGPVRRPGTH